MGNNLYKNRYLIGLYDQDDCGVLVNIVDNTNEFADYCGMTKKQAADKLSKVFKDKDSGLVYVKNRKLLIAFIDDKEE